MADSERNPLGGKGGARRRRNQRTEAPVQPGALGDDQPDRGDQFPPPDSAELAHPAHPPDSEER
ncbi:MAG TPA: hypothetical protein VNK43_10125 [Gemmatimonadales bacterium]|nr:hypothetical protein [Gemmatimonadales bacterium]